MSLVKGSLVGSETSMASSFVVPVVDVQIDNFTELWPALVLAIKSSCFVAVDTELSGLGNRKALLAESIEERYKAICQAARSRSIISLGISCFKKIDHKIANTYLVQVYNLTLLCSEEYTIEPQSVQFLVQHGFDFNKQYSHGIPYHKGNDKAGSDDHGVHIRALFTELLRAKKPLILHNGLIDIVYLYQSFYAQLPERLATFVADLSEMFPAGIYDTKYVSEFELRLMASYLEYAYKKCKLVNSRSVSSGAVGPHVFLQFCDYSGNMSTYVDYRHCPDVTFTEEQTDICQRFSAFGWCKNGTQCPLSHDTDLIILQDEKLKDDKRNKRKRRKEKKKLLANSSNAEGSSPNKRPKMEVDSEHGAVASCPDTVPLLDCPPHTGQDESQGLKTEADAICDDITELASSQFETDHTSTSIQSNDIGAEAGNGGLEKSANCNAEKQTDAGTHRAGFDAFMTGYIFAYSCILIKKERDGKAGEDEKEEGEEQRWLPTCLNKVYLSGKTTPLNVVKSTFSNSSKAHIHKMKMVWGRRKQ